MIDEEKMSNVIFILMELISTKCKQPMNEIWRDRILSVQLQSPVQ